MNSALNQISDNLFHNNTSTSNADIEKALCETTLLFLYKKYDINCSVIYLKTQNCDAKQLEKISCKINGEEVRYGKHILPNQGLVESCLLLNKTIQINNLPFDYLHVPHTQESAFCQLTMTPITLGYKTIGMIEFATTIEIESKQLKEIEQHCKILAKDLYKLRNELKEVMLEAV